MKKDKNYIKSLRKGDQYWSDCFSYLDQFQDLTLNLIQEMSKKGQVSYSEIFWIKNIRQQIRMRKIPNNEQKKEIVEYLKEKESNLVVTYQ